MCIESSDLWTDWECPVCYKVLFGCTQCASARLSDGQGGTIWRYQKFAYLNKQKHAANKYAHVQLKRPSAGGKPSLDPSKDKNTVHNKMKKMAERKSKRLKVSMEVYQLPSLRIYNGKKQQF